MIGGGDIGVGISWFDMVTSRTKKVSERGKTSIA